jgi:CRP-like cAMP-binding protein
MHVFLLPLPRLEFAALIPKGDYVTVCLLGKDIDDALVQLFLDASEVKLCLPPDWEMPRDVCHCSPRINTRAAHAPFADRIVFIGDAGATRLYKDGLGAAYRTAKAAAVTALFEGVSARDFQRCYAPVCRTIEFDNGIGKLMFFVAGLQRAVPSSRRGILRMVAREQRQSKGPRRMSDVMWDMFTGSSSYRAIFVRTLHPFFLPRLLREILAGMISPFHTRDTEPGLSEASSLGKVYQDGEIIVQEGEFGNCMYVVQEGQVEVLQGRPGALVRLTVQGKGAIFGEIALMQGEIRSATVRAMGPARVLTVDKATFLHRIHEDPSMAYRMMVNMSQRIRDLSDEVVSLKTPDVANGNPQRPLRPGAPGADIRIMPLNSATGAPTNEAPTE